MKYMKAEFPKFQKFSRRFRDWKLNDHIFKKFKYEEEEL